MFECSEVHLLYSSPLYLPEGRSDKLLHFCHDEDDRSERCSGTHVGQIHNLSSKQTTDLGPVSTFEVQQIRWHANKMRYTIKTKWISEPVHVRKEIQSRCLTWALCLYDDRLTWRSEPPRPGSITIFWRTRQQKNFRDAPATAAMLLTDSHLRSVRDKLEHTVVLHLADDVINIEVLVRDHLLMQIDDVAPARERNAHLDFWHGSLRVVNAVQGVKRPDAHLQKNSGSCCWRTHTIAVVQAME